MLCAPLFLPRTGRAESRSEETQTYHPTQSPRRGTFVYPGRIPCKTRNLAASVSLAAFLFIWMVLSVPPALAQKPSVSPNAGPSARADQALADCFRAETKRLADHCLADIESLDAWNMRRVRLQRQLQEMLGLWPLPERTALRLVITGRLEHEEFTVEKLHFQASPRLYVCNRQLVTCPGFDQSRAGHSLPLRPFAPNHQCRELG